MLWQLALGGGLLAASTIIQVAFIAGAVAALRRFSAWFATPPQLVKSALGVAAAAVWLMASHWMAVWLWSEALLAIGAFDVRETSVYFAVVCFTTLGFGDIVPEQDWRILAALCAANGLLTFGVSTAFLVEMMRRIQLVSPDGAGES